MTLHDTDHRALRDERDFLLRSIEDLEDQRAAGEIDEAAYEQLLEDYTARAAAALRSLASAENEPRAEPPTTGPRRRWPVAVVLAAVVVVALVLLPRALRDRQPGETVTGNAQSAATSVPLEDLERRAAERAEDPGAQLALARALLEVRDLVGALKAYDRAAALDPSNPEPHAYGGWIVLLAGLTDEALPRLDRAIAADAAYPDARFFRAMALRRADRAAEAVDELESYLRLVGDVDPMRPQVEALLVELRSSSTPTTTP